jgi:hypothetical protein
MGWVPEDESRAGEELGGKAGDGWAISSQAVLTYKQQDPTSMTFSLTSFLVTLFNNHLRGV